MKKKVLYSLAALSALPGASYAETINVDANNSATLDQTASGSDATLANAVFTSGANYKLVINVANSLMPGKYLLKATADNGEPNNNLTVSYTVGGGAAVNSDVNALAEGITIDVAKASKSKIVLTVEDTNEEKAAFTVAGLTLQLQFDFDQVYTTLIGKFNNAFTPAVLAYQGINDQLQTRLNTLEQQAVEYADNAGGTKGSQNYSTYSTNKFYNLFSNGQYNYNGINNLALYTTYATAVDALLADINAAENTRRSTAALDGYDALWAKVKEDGTLETAIEAIDDDATDEIAPYGPEDLTTNAEYGLTKLRNDVTGLKTTKEGLDEVFTTSGQVQDYSNINFNNISTADLEAQIAKVKNNFQGWTDNTGDEPVAHQGFKADKTAYNGLVATVATLTTAYNGLTAGGNVSLADYNTIKTKKEAIDAAMTTYSNELTTNNEGFKYALATATHDKTIAQIADMVAELDGNEGMIATVKAAYEALQAADATAATTVQTQTTTLTASLGTAESAVGALETIMDGTTEIYKASSYFTAPDDISAAIARIGTDAAAVEHVSDYVAQNQQSEDIAFTGNVGSSSWEFSGDLTKLPKGKFVYIYDEASYNNALAKGYLDRYYAKWPTEDLWNPTANRPANGNDLTNGIPDGFTHTWDAAYGIANGDGTHQPNHSFPWIVLAVDPDYEGGIVSTYDGNPNTQDQSDHPQGKGYFIISVPKDLHLTQFSLWEADDNNWVGPEGLDLSKLEVKLSATNKIMALDYATAVEAVEDDITGYQTEAEAAYNKFSDQWDLYTGLVADYEALDVIEDYAEDATAIGTEIAAVKTTLIAVTQKLDAEHIAAVEALDIAETVNDIKDEIAELQAISDMAKAAAAALEARNTAKAAADLLLNQISELTANNEIYLLANAYGLGENQESAQNDPQGVVAGSAVGARLKEAKELWDGRYKTLVATYNSAATMGDVEAKAVYDKLAANDDDITLTDVQKALFETVFEGYEGEGDGEKGLVYALTQHKNAVQTNNANKVTAYQALGYVENGDVDTWDPGIANSLAHVLEQDRVNAQANVSNAAASNTNVNGLTAGQIIIANGDGQENAGTIATTIAAIKDKVDALKALVDADFAEEKLGTTWTNDQVKENQTVKAYKDQVTDLKAEADAVVTNTNSWIADTKNWNELTTLKANVTAAETLSEQTTLPDILPNVEQEADAAYAHYNSILTAETTGLKAQIAAVEIPDVPATIISAGADRVLPGGTNGAYTTLKATLTGYANDITANETNATTNKGAYAAIYSGAQSEYAVVAAALAQLNTDLAALEATPAKTALQEAYDAQLVKLGEAETSIKAHYAAGNYQEGQTSAAYTSDKALLTAITNAITQAREAFDENYGNNIVALNATAKSAMDALLAETQQNVNMANDVLADYQAIGQKVADVTAALANTQPINVDGMLQISANIAAHVNACNTRNRLYELDGTGEYNPDGVAGTNDLSGYYTDQTAIGAIVTNIRGFATNAVLPANNALITQWADIAEANTYAGDNGDAAQIAALADNTDTNVVTKMTAAKALLDAGNAANTALAQAVAAVNLNFGEGDPTIMDQIDKVNIVVANADALADAIVAYNNAETGYEKLVADAKNLAAKSDITKKAADWRATNVTAVLDGLNAETATYTVDNENILAGVNLTKMEGNVTRLQALIAIVNGATGAIDALDAAIAGTTDANFYTAYTAQNGLLALYNALAIDLSQIATKVAEWKAADQLYADIQAKINTYAILTAAGELDETSTATLNAKYVEDKDLVAGSKAENANGVANQLSAYKTAIENFAKANYASVADVEEAYTNGPWDAYMNYALTAEQDAIAADKETLNDLFEDYKNTNVTFEAKAAMQANIAAINAESNDFATLKGYEPLIAEYVSTMDVAINDVDPATLLAEFQALAEALEIGADATAFVEFVGGTDTNNYFTTIKNATTGVVNSYTQLNERIATLNTNLTDGETYKEENINYYKTEVQNEIDAIGEAITALTNVVTQTANNTLTMTPKAAMEDYNARKEANATAYTTLSQQKSAVQQALATAQQEYPGINVDLTALDDIDADYATLDLVELVQGVYTVKPAYEEDIEDATDAIADALQDARANEINTLIQERELATIAARVNTAIAQKGLIGLAKQNLETQRDQYVSQYNTLKGQFDAAVDAGTLEAGAFKDDLTTLANNVDALIESIPEYKQPGDIAGGTEGGDGEVGADDFTALKNVILTGDMGNYTLEQLDLNGDNKVSIGDLVMLNNIMLGLNPDGTEPNAARAWFGSSESVTTEMTVTGNQTKRIAVNLKNSSEYVAFQMDIVLPEGMKIVGESLTERARTQKLASAELENGAHRIITIPLLNTTFQGNEGAVLYIDVETDHNYKGGDIEMENVIFSNRMGNDSRFNVNGGIITGIMDSMSNAAKTAKDTIYDMGGKVKNGLKKGINIIRKADGSSEKVMKK